MAEAVTQQLAALREGTGDQLTEQLRIHRRRRLERQHAHNRRVHPRRRVEGLGRHVEHRFDVVAPLQHHAQATVILAARPGSHAVDDLLLEHEVLVDHVVHRLQQMEEDGGRDVVGQIADDAQPRTLGGRQRPEVDLQHIAFDDLDIVAGAEPGGQVTVQFDDGQRPVSGQQRQRHRAEPGADLDQGLTRLRVDQVDDGVDQRRVGQEMLAKALARNMGRQSSHSRTSTKALARRSLTQSW
mmetsp:Transcript_49602/g.116474  ORF Transcript_49602/g.116474 Transcript_49602/m.116474 type:complete len:241 (+) Transcript_49602:2960-3682(+)